MHNNAGGKEIQRAQAAVKISAQREPHISGRIEKGFPVIGHNGFGGETLPFYFAV